VIVFSIKASALGALFHWVFFTFGPFLDCYFGGDFLPFFWASPIFSLCQFLPCGDFKPLGTLNRSWPRLVLDVPGRARIFANCLAWADDVLRSAGDLVERIVLSQPSDKRSSQLQGMQDCLIQLTFVVRSGRVRHSPQPCFQERQPKRI